MAWLLTPLRPTFEAALRDVRARGLEARLAAAERLGDADAGREAEAFDGLMVLCRDLDARVRAAALSGMPGHDDVRVTDLLIGALDDGDSLVREVAIGGLGGVPSERARLAIAEALESPHAEVRFQAIESYLEVERKPSLARIEPLLDDDDPRVRENATAQASRFGALAVAALRRKLDDARQRVRQRAALGLGELGEADAADALAGMLHDPELCVEALEVLGGLGAAAAPTAAEAVATIAEAYLKPLPLKVAAARALVRMGDGRGVPALRVVLRALRPDGRTYAAEVIGELGLNELAPELRRLADRPRGTDPLALVEALGALLERSPEAREGLEISARRSDEAGARARGLLQSPTES